MANAVIETLRAAQFKRLQKMKTFSVCWPTWKSQIDELTSARRDANAIFNLGEHLSEIFKSTGEGRTQSSQSGGGAAWEGLVCWYLNFVLAGTTAIVIKQNKGLVPPIVLDATTVKYGNEKTNTESDLVGIILPEDVELAEGSPSQVIDEYVRLNIGDCDLRVIQCKTNWNDNAQIPMLWDMVYQGKYAGNASVVLGAGGVSVRKFRSFKYSFVTVPSGSSTYKNSSVAVKRLGGLTGGNYWGKPHLPGVAYSLSDIFNDQFSMAFPGSVQQSISQAISDNLLSTLA